jgi:hypothetical protein
MEPVIFLHGFSHDVLFKIVDAAKTAAKEAGVDPASGHPVIIAGKAQAEKAAARLGCEVTELPI